MIRDLFSIRFVATAKSQVPQAQSASKSAAMDKWSGEWAIRSGTRTDRNTPSSQPPEQSATAVK